MIATRLLWEAAGRPAPAAASVARLIVDQPGQCGMCGEHSDRTADTDRSLGANFSDRALFRWPGGRTCPACLWVCSGKPPATLRMWSIICAPGVTLPPSDPKAWLQDTPGLHLGSRRSAPHVGRFLGDPPAGPWMVSIALSGQKHVAPYAHVNHGRGPWRVRVEDHNVTSSPDEWRTIREHALALRRLGIPEQPIHDGHPARLRTREQLATWAHHNQHLLPYLRSPLLGLALWTITREDIQP